MKEKDTSDANLKHITSHTSRWWKRSHMAGHTEWGTKTEKFEGRVRVIQQKPSSPNKYRVFIKRASRNHIFQKTAEEYLKRLFKEYKETVLIDTDFIFETSRNIESLFNNRSGSEVYQKQMLKLSTWTRSIGEMLPSG